MGKGSEGDESDPEDAVAEEVEEFDPGGRACGERIPGNLGPRREPRRGRRVCDPVGELGTVLDEMGDLERHRTHGDVGQHPLGHACEKGPHCASII